MRDDINNMLARIQGDDETDCQNAITDLMFKMEDSTRHIFKHGEGDDQYLSQAEQAELIDVLIDLAESLRPEYAGLLWVVSKAIPMVMIDPVQAFILTYADTMPEHMFRQSLVALQNCFGAKEGSPELAIMRDKLKRAELTTKIRAQETRVTLTDNILQDTISCLDVFCNP